MDKSIVEASKVQIGNINSKNFKTWKFKFLMVLKGVPGALDILEGKRPKPVLQGMATPEEKAMYTKDLEEYNRIDSTIVVLLTTNMSDDTLQKLMRFDNSKDMWDELQRLYGGCIIDRSYELCQNFFGYQKEPSHDMATHISSLKGIWYELNSALNTTGDLPEILLIYQILHTLPSEYFGFKSSWLLMSKTDRTVNNLTVQLCAHEKVIINKVEEETLSISEALYTKAEEKKKKDKKKKNNFHKCNYCGETGHFVRKCKKWISDGRPPKKSTAVNMNLTVLTIEEDFRNDVKNSTDWYVDNGATSHVTNRGDLFQDFIYFKSSHTVTGANGQSIQAIGIGTIRAEAEVEGRLEQILLKDVWYVPAISKNLYSVLATHDIVKDSIFESTPFECVMKINGAKKLIGTRDVQGGLYRLKMRCLKPTVDVNQLSTSSLLQLYHERFGHQNKLHVKKLLEKEFHIKTEATKELCEGCIYGKLHRQKFGIREKPSKPGELICTDICGPFPYSISKHRYFVLFKDVHTNYRWVYLLHQKSEVYLKLPLLIAEVKAAGHVIRELLSDNGGEFNNDNVSAILKKEGIKQRLTMPYTPQQNPTERENRTVVEMTRTLMHAHETIPAGLWAELIQTAVYILNRTGPGHNGKSPHESWYGVKPRITHLRVIGTICYPHIPKQRRHKLDKKAQKGILIGYDSDEGYRIWDNIQQVIVRSRDVTFNETPLVSPIKSMADSKSELENIQESEQRKYRTDEQQSNFQFNFPNIDVECEKNRTLREPSIRNNDDNNEITEPDIVNDNNDNIIDSTVPILLGQHNGSEQSVDSDNQDVDEAAANTAPLSASEVENEGSMTLRNRASLRPPNRYGDFICNICNVNLTEESLLEPTTFKQAMISTESDMWRAAMDTEINSLQENQTWEMVDLPKGRKAIPCKWIYKIKTNPDGTIEKYKARLVIKGYSQKKGLDYYETFSPVAKTSTIRAVLSIAAQENLTLSQFDVTTAFLYGSLNEEIYMKPPEGYNDNSGKVCKLKKSLYGLKQAPRCWNHCITEYILKIGFEQNSSDPCLFIRNKDKKDRKLILALYVDDGLIASSNPKETENFLNEMRQQFKITTKSGSYFLGIEIERHVDGSIKIHQQGYSKRLLERFGMQNCKAAVTPIVKDSNIPIEKEKESITFPYRQAVGALSYLAIGTRPDIAYALSVVSRNLDNPSSEDITKVKRVLRYIKGTTDYGITYQSSVKSTCILSYSDADHGGDTVTGRSTSGMICLYSNGAIAWQSKRQSSVAISSTEAEIVAASETTRELIWLKRILQFMIMGDVTMKLYLDNESAIRLAHDPPFECHQRTKHIRLRHFFIRECVISGCLEVFKTDGENQLADFLTKPLFKPRLMQLCKQVGLKEETGC